MLTPEGKIFRKKIILTFHILIFLSPVKAQKIDSIFFHLYTDSLKKGVHNYINVDGKLSNGRWLPLTAKEVTFSSSHGIFEGNDLILPADFREDTVTVNAVLKENTMIRKEIIIWIKKLPDPDKLPTEDEINKHKKRRKNKFRDY